MGHFALGIPSLFLTARLVCNEMFTLVFEGGVAPTYGADFGKTGESKNKLEKLVSHKTSWKNR